MNEHEAINELEEGMTLSFGNPISNEAAKIAISALEEVQEYRAIGTIEELEKIKQCAFSGVELFAIASAQMELKKYIAIGTVQECREAVEKQKTAQVAKLIDGVTECCGYDFGMDAFEKPKFCPMCGKKIERSEEE